MATFSFSEHLQFLLKKFNLSPIIYAFSQAGGKAFLVGGSVRDLLLNNAIRDLDIEVYGLSLDSVEEILSRFEPVEPVGKSFGVFKLFAGQVDISLPRLDSTPGRKPHVAVVPDLSLDKALERRDLTINAIAIDLNNSRLCDPLSGQADLRALLLRSPQPSFFIEDPLRFWRVFQFIGRFDARVDDSLSSVCQSMSLDGVSFERIENEIIKWAELSQNPYKSIEWISSIKRTSLLGKHFLENADLKSLQALFYVLDPFIYNSVFEKIVLRLSCLCYVGADINLLTRNTRIKKAVQLLMSSCVRDLQEEEILLLAYSLRAARINIRTLIMFLYAIGKISRQKWVDLTHIFSFSGCLFRPLDPLLKAEDFMVLGYTGPQLGVLLQKAYTMQINQKITDKSVLLQYVLRSIEE